MMRRGTDQVVARFSIANFCNFAGHLFPHELATFARFGSLRHLDLKFLTIDKVLSIYSKAPTGNLPDTTPQPTASHVAIQGQIPRVGLTLFHDHLPKI